MRVAIFISSVVIIGSLFVTSIEGHAYLFFPTQRSRDGTVWNCGTNPATGVGWFQGGDITGPKCGICGDSLALSSPRPNEFNGVNYGWGLSEVYRQGQVMIAVVNVPNPHGPAIGDIGIQFRLCTDPTNITQACFENVLKIQSAVTLIEEYSNFIKQTSDINVEIVYGYRPDNNDLWVRFYLQLPSDVVCEHCVIQMGYLGGQGGGSGVLFRSCTDVAILPAPTPVQMLKNVGAGQCLSLTQDITKNTIELDDCSNTAIGQSIFNFQDWELYATNSGAISFEASNYCLNVDSDSVSSGGSVVQFQCQFQKGQYNELWTSIPSVSNSANFQLVAQAGNPKGPTPGNCLTAQAISKSSPPAYKIIQSKCDSTNLLQSWTVVKS